MLLIMMVIKKNQTNCLKKWCEVGADMSSSNAKNLLLYYGFFETYIDDIIDHKINGDDDYWC